MPWLGFCEAAHRVERTDQKGNRKDPEEDERRKRH